MSTILDTLKKLEAEKSVLNKTVDLKSMMLEEEGSEPGIGRDRLLGWVWLMLALGAGVVLVLGMVWNRAVPPSVPLEQRATANAPAAPDAKTERIGVTMGGVPENVSVAQPESKAKKPEPLEEPISYVVVARDEPKKVESLLVPPVSPTTPALAPKTEASKVNLVAQDAQVLPAGTQPPPPVQASGKSTRIAGLQIKGIIFFGEDNEANYLLIATPKQQSVKLKVGETLEGATLKEIHRQSAIFFHHGQTLRLAMGE
jgi:hypothetical protein